MRATPNELIDISRRVLFFILGGLILPVALFFVLAQAPVRAQANVLFVDTAAGGAGNGSSWSDAYTTVQDALADASSGDEIWVAKGVYYPDEGTGQSNNDRESSFQLLNDVAIYGGFAATETVRSERDWESNVTVLSGDIDGNDTVDGDGVVHDPANDLVGDNAYHVVTGSGVTPTALLDGFTITGGDGVSDDDAIPGGGGMYNEFGSPSLANLAFRGNRAEIGGGMVNLDSRNVTLTNVTFSRNLALGGGGMANALSNVTLSDVTFSENLGLAGGGIFSLDSNSILTNATFVANQAEEGGGAIANLTGVLTLTNSHVMSNSTLVASGNGTGFGGGIVNIGILHIASSQVEGNVTGDGEQDSGNDGGDGGGIYNEGTLVITSTSITRNRTGNGAFESFASGNGGNGGGIYNSGSLTITTSLIAENRTGDGGPADPVGGAGGSGGGVFNDSSDATVTIVASSIISNNTGASPPFTSLQANGGGLANNRGALRLVNSTVSGNEAEGHGGGLYEAANRTSYLHNVTVTGNRADANEDDTGDGGGVYSSGSIYLYNSILAGNSDGSSSLVHPDCSFDGFLGATLEAALYNLVGEDSGCDGIFDDDPGNDIEGNLVGVAPTLAALGDYGGPTPTHALYPTSPARDAGDPDGCIDDKGDALSTDQHGEPRPEATGGRCDMGAVEYMPPVISLEVSPASVIEDGGAALTFTFNRTRNTLGVITATFDVDGAATFNTDYVQSGADSFDGSSGEITFGDGNGNRTLLITPTADFLAEPDETVIITLTGSTEYESGTVSTVTGTIIDDDSAGVVITPTAGLTSTEAGSAATFSVTLQSEPTDTVIVTLSSSDVTEGTVSPSTLQFDAGNWQTPQLVTVTGVDDEEVDGDVDYTIQFNVNSDDADYDGIAIADLSVTNVDDDVPTVYMLYIPEYYTRSYVSSE